MQSDGQQDAIASGRRIYLGNLLYSVKPNDVEELLTNNGFGNFDKVHISIDPVSSRNPGYCFVDFLDKETADRALETLDANIGGRPLKVGPCEPKKPRAIRWGRDENSTSSPSFQRWGDWNSNKDANEPTGTDGPRAALKHFDEVSQSDGRRLYVGGLPKMIDQEQNQAELQQIFEGFNPAVISKRITPHESTRSKPGNHHYCFVDFNTKEEAEEARLKLHGIEYNGDLLKVRTAGPPPDKSRSNRPDNRYERRGHDGESPRQNRNSERTSEPSRGFASRDWRRKDE